jgi:hypothetical protein
MIRSFVLCCIILLHAKGLTGQVNSERVNNSSIPIIITLHFQNLSMPFRDLKSNFGHLGISIGTEFYYNNSKSWSQQVHLGYYFNKQTGNALMLYTQAVYRPFNNEQFSPELKSGIGWQLVSHPVQSLKFNNSKWVRYSKSKLQWIVPTGIGLGYKTDSQYSVFASYQVVPTFFYNKSIPLSFNSFFQTGILINTLK